MMSRTDRCVRRVARRLRRDGRSRELRLRAARACANAKRRCSNAPMPSSPAAARCMRTAARTARRCAAIRAAWSSNASPRTTAPHPIPAMLRGPVFAYVGVIDERLDYDLIAALADAFPDGHVLLAGPVVKVDPRRLAATRQRALHRPHAVRCAAVAARRRRRRADAVRDQPRHGIDLADEDARIFRRAQARRLDADRRCGRRRTATSCISPPAPMRSSRAVHEALRARRSGSSADSRRPPTQTWDAIFARMWDDDLRVKARAVRCRRARCAGCAS